MSASQSTGKLAALQTKNNMTTKTKNNLTPAPITKILGKECRYTKSDNKKFLYYTDLVKIAGKDFVKELRTPPIVLRVSDGSNSQDRRLVNVTDFRNAHNVVKEKKKLLKTTKAKVAKHVAEQFCFPFEGSSETKEIVSSKLSDSTKPAATEQKVDLLSVKIDVSSVKSIYDQPDAQHNLIKSQINGIVHKYVNSQIVENGFTDDSAESCTLRTNAYIALYSQFDAAYAAALKEHNFTLEHAGLGPDVRFKSKYMDLLAEKGLLPVLLTVAKQFFSKPR